MTLPPVRLSPDSPPMVRAVVVNRDQGLAGQQAEALRAAGYEVELCGGPQHEPCPVLDSLPCPLVARADGVVYDAWVRGRSGGGGELIAQLRETYVDLPVVLTSVDRSLAWVETEGPHRVTPLVGTPTPEELRAGAGAG